MGITVGGYTTDEAVATGGSAQVFRGHAQDGRVVAMKVLDGPVEAAVRRARREAGLAAEVDHPHVVEVLDVVADDTRVVVVTAFAAGGSLADLLARRGRLTVPEALTVLLPIAAAIATAHERGVVHGDLSPANILFEASGRPMLADLGAARAAGELGEPASATPGYVAPEVARGAPVTAAADLFSLGAVALHCLTGRPAWNADDLRDVVIQSTVGQWPDPADDEVPAVLATTLRGLLEADPVQRPGAAGVVIDLRRSGTPEPVDLALHLIRPASALAPTVARSDAPRRPEPAASGSKGPRRAKHRAIPRRLMPRVAVLGGAALLVILAVLAGLWWAAWDRPQPSEVGPVAASATSAASAGPTSSGAVSTAGAGGSVAGVTTSSLVQSPDPGATARGSTAQGSTARGSPARGTAAPSSSFPGSTVRSSVDPHPTVRSSVPPHATDWLAVVRELDAQRAAALAGADPARLDRVYAADAEARLADARTIEVLRARGLRVDPPIHVIATVHTVSTSGDEVTVEVVDELPAYPVVDAAGQVVGTAPGRPSGHRVLGLVRTGDGYRISTIGS